MNRKARWNALAGHANLLRAGLLLAVLSGACLVGLASYIAVRAAVLSFSKAQAGGPALSGYSSTPGANAPGTARPGTAAENPNRPDSLPTLTPWDGAGRVTVLLLGLDYRDWEAGSGASRSDTMILLTLDPLTKTAGILSIPRDMWVSIPGFKHGKINTAYYLGDAYKLPGGGPGLAVKTVEQFLGVPINYYAQIDFAAFVQFIDEIGGVKIEVPEKITVDLLGGGGAKTKKTLQPGVQVLPGEWALAYARARYTQGGDFDRADRQQQVILAIRDRILSFNLLPTLITKAPTLYNQLAAGIHTNLSLNDVIQLAVFALGVPDEQLQRGVLGQAHTIFGRSPDNLSILIPIPDKIHLLRDEIFATSSGLGPETPGSAQQQMQAEAGRVVIYNGSRTAERAGRAADFLRSQGMNVTQAGEAGQRYGRTVLVDHTGSPYTVKYLAELLGVPSENIAFRYDPASAVDVEIYFGDDWQP